MELVPHLLYRFSAVWTQLADSARGKTMFKETSVVNSTNAGESRRSTDKSIKVWRLAIYCFAILTACQSMGCRNTMENVALSWRDLVWSRRAYNLRYGGCGQPFGDHFRSGFEAGYEDVCNGGDGYVPALPPDSYRGVEYQSEEGAKCVNAWFEGYPAGVAAARKDRAGNYNDVLISKMINSALAQEKALHALPQDVPVVGPENKLMPRDDAAVANIAAAPSMPSFSSIRSAWRSKFKPEDNQDLVPFLYNTTPDVRPPLVHGSGVEPGSLPPGVGPQDASQSPEN